jgi:Trk K+ transport system NAD-binding subunit
MAKGSGALIGGLAVLSFTIILISASILVLSGATQEGSESLNFTEAFWESLMRSLDAGTMGGDTGWGFRLVMFLLPTLGGVFIISALIGVLTNAIENKMEYLRKGKSQVIENNHTVILGWSPQVFSILAELVTANENQHRPCIVILGDKDKVEMEEEIRSNVPDQKNTRFVCRTGNPIDLNDLDMVSLQATKSIIILSPQGSDNPDSETIKTILAITNSAERRESPYHIIAEIHDPKNMEVARMVGKDEVELVLVEGLIARITAQTCRQSGLSIIYTELLDFGGDEIYFKHEPALEGKTYGEALTAFDRSSLIGIFSADNSVRLNPPMDTRIQPGDKIVAISEDDDKIILAKNTMPEIDEKSILEYKANTPVPEKTLLLGWNMRAPVIINEMDNYVAKGSILDVVANYEGGEKEIKRLCRNISNQKISYHEMDTTDRRVLDELNIRQYDHIILLCYADGLDIQAADARTLITLLHLRDIGEQDGSDFAIVSEMLDLRNRNLAEVTQADDFIVSDKLISLMMSQISENKYLNAVFKDIFDPEGSEIYLKPASSYVKIGEQVSYYCVVEAARRRGETVIGYRSMADSKNAAKAYGVVVNPDKTKPVIFYDHDRVIVLAEN